MQLRGHCDDHMVKVRVEVSTLGDIVTEWSVVVISSEHVVRVVHQSWGVRIDL